MVVGLAALAIWRGQNPGSFHWFTAFLIGFGWEPVVEKLFRSKVWSAKRASRSVFLSIVAWGHLMSQLRPFLLSSGVAVIALLLLNGSFAQLTIFAVVGASAADDITRSVASTSDLSDQDFEKIAMQLRSLLQLSRIDDATTPSLASTKTTPTLSPPEALKISPLHSPRIANGQEFFKGAQYVGAETCKECHAERYDDWRKTWHSRMEAWPTTSNVIGDFNQREVTYPNIKVPIPNTGTEGTISPSVLASKEGDKFYMTLLDKDNPAKNVKYEIAKVLGGKWDQHYEVKIDARYYPTPLRWSVKAGDWLIADYRPADWFEYDGTADGTPKRPPPGSAAEAKCAGCHTTGYEYKKVSGLWQATGHGEISVACESCHGPASKHIEQARSAKVRGEELRNSTIAHPLRDLTASQQNQICAQPRTSLQQTVSSGSQFSDRILSWRFGHNRPLQFLELLWIFR